MVEISKISTSFMILVGRVTLAPKLAFCIKALHACITKRRVTAIWRRRNDRNIFRATEAEVNQNNLRAGESNERQVQLLLLAASGKDSSFGCVRRREKREEKRKEKRKKKREEKNPFCTHIHTMLCVSVD
jgi:hypothetical protein